MKYRQFLYKKTDSVNIKNIRKTDKYIIRY